MKRFLYASLGLMATAFVLQAQTAAKWTFETSVPATAGPFSPEVGSGSALGSHSDVSAVYSNPVGNGSGESFSVNFWNVEDYWQFQVSTLGINNVGLSWDQASSSTGPKDFRLDYSLDGSAWTTAMTYSPLVNGSPNISWGSGAYNPAYTFFYDFGGAVDNQPSVYFRLVDNSTVSEGGNGGVVATGGTDRIDNVTVAVVPEPSSLSLMGGFALLAWTFIRPRK